MAAPRTPSPPTAPDGQPPGREAVQQVVDRLGVPLPAEAVDRLTAYVALLLRWNSTYNLTALRDNRQVLTHHLADCLAILPTLRRVLAGRAAPRLLDVGSGGGLPGIVIAIAEPAWQVRCIDTVGKKAAFIRQAGGELALGNVHAIHGRVEQQRGADHDAIVSRAFATLSDFTRWSGGALKADGVWVAMKGGVPHDEMAALPPGVQVFHVEHLHVSGLDAARCLVVMKPAPP